MRVFFAALLATSQVGCGAQPRSAVRVNVSAPGLALASLSIEIDDGDADAGLTRPVPPAGGAPSLPGTIEILVGDNAPLVHVHLDGRLADGSARTADGSVRSVPHKEVILALELGDGGAPDGGTDLAPPDLGHDFSAPLLAEDTFSRPDQPHWGTASDGQTWTGDANALSFFSIATKHGLIANGANGTSYGSLLGAAATDVDVQVTAAIDTLLFPTGSFGLVARAVDTTNFYKAYLDMNGLTLQKEVASVKTNLKVIPFTFNPGVDYTIRLSVTGASLSVKAWPAAQAEPAAFAATVTDGTFASGRVGIRASAPAADAVRYSHFLAVRN